MTNYDLEPEQMTDAQWHADVDPREVVAAGVIAARAYLRADMEEVFALIRDADTRTVAFGILGLVIPMGERLFRSASEFDEWLVDRLTDLREGNGPGRAA